MPVQEPVTYQCINTSCGHLLPRVVKFCPYCGTPQQANSVRPAPAAAPVVAAPVVAAPVVADPVVADPVVVPVDIPQQTYVPPPAAAPPVDPATPPRAAPAAAIPPQRAPLHWIWWLASLGLLWLAWITARPAAHKLDARIDAAIVLAQECKGKQAQSELIALRATRATPAQLQRLQTALNDAASACTRKLARGKAWADASSAIDAALAAYALDRAGNRLSTFTRRWGEGEETREAKTRIDAARREQSNLNPSDSGSGNSRALANDSARNLINEAEREINRGNYKGAINKMDACVVIVDAGNPDCIALKTKAERLYQGL